MIMFSDSLEQALQRVGEQTRDSGRPNAPRVHVAQSQHTARW